MKKTKIILISSIICALFTFSIWPVLSGTEISPDCRDNPIADCLSIEKYSPRILYYLGDQKFDDAGFDSRSQYCDITESCKSELVYIPLSILLGAAGGAIFGFAYTRLKKNH